MQPAPQEFFPVTMNGVAENAMPIHSVFGASSSSRWMACPASIRMSKYVEDQTNDAAELGTAAHELVEFCLKLGLNTYDCLGLVFNKHTVDEAMASAAQLYVGCIRDLCRRYNVNPMLEKRVVMLSVANDVYGTADCIIIVGDTLFVFDYKHGYEIVEVTNNPQAVFYAIATLDTLGLWQQIKHIVTGIIQPRASHIDGVIRLHDYSIQELVSWQNQFRVAVSNARNPHSEIIPGAHCKYCPARGFCRARMMRTIQLAYFDKPIEEMTPNELEIIYNEIDIMKTNLEAVAGKTLGLAREGKSIENHKLVKSITRAKCEDEKGFVEAALATETVKEKDLYNVKLKSMTDCKRLLKDNIGIVNKYFVKPPSSTTLVKMKDSRPAVAIGSAEGVFNSVDAKPVSAAGIFNEVQ